MKSRIPASLLLVLAACGGREDGVTLRPPRHVFLITVDTLRADHMSLYGYVRQTSPRLARLAVQGATFERAVAQWPKTGSSFASMFTGLYPHTTGLTQKAALRVPEGYLTLPELMQESGYTTLAVQSNAVLGARLGWNDGFEEYLETWGGGDFPQDPQAFRPLAGAPRVNELALPLLQKHKDRDHLFVWIHYSDPHAPYMLPAGVDNPFLGDAHSVEQATIPKKVTPGYRLGEHTELKHYVAQYDANVLVADGAIDQLLAEARRLGLLEDSLVLFTADHGESLGEHDSWFEHGPLPYNTTAHVPLVILASWVEAGRRVEEPVELVDLYPTIRQLVAPRRKVAGLEGKSLLPLLTGQAGDAFVHAFSSAGKRPNFYNSVQEKTWKLVLNAGGRRSRAAASTTGGFELYDLSKDPLETTNLAATHPEELRRLKRDLAAWMRAAQAMGEDETVDPETERALRALGYAN